MINFTKLPIRTYYFRYYLIKNPNTINLARPFMQVNNCAQMRLYSNIFQTSNLLKSTNSLFLDVVRHKAKSSGGKKYGKQRYYEDDDEEEDEDKEFDEDDDEKFKTHGIQVKTVSTDSIRIDKIVKSALKVGRKRIEEIFYENKLRLNEKKLLKKGTKIKAGDEIDIIMDVPSENPDRLTVTRIEIIDIKVDEDKNVYLVKLKVLKSLLINNYEFRGQEQRTY